MITHQITDGTLRVRIVRDLDVTNRAAAALQIEALVHAHRPRHVAVELPTQDPSPMTFSALARAQRMCQSLGVTLAVTGPGGRTAVTPFGGASGASRSERLEHGARHDH
ncbi:hypothetical protein [Streptomyces sp. NPDC012888]|uniref:hypothetical protein n=1 Tax=Streptomyces sp. NPDC012888 TaxID=3364855 RepID=UPI00367D9EFF